MNSEGGDCLLKEIILAIIISFDTYLVAVTYCNRGIRIPLLSATVINIAGASLIGISLLLSDIASSFIPSGLFNTIGLIVLTSIGVITLFKSLIRKLVRRFSKDGVCSIRTWKDGLVIKLYLDDTAADIDGSKILSPAEATVLALVSSIDAVATGLSCGFCDISPFRTALFTFIAGFAAITAGNVTGKKMSASEHDFSWLGGALLIAFAFSETLH